MTKALPTIPMLPDHQRLIISKIGHLSAPLVERVNACLKAALDLP